MLTLTPACSNSANWITPALAARRGEPSASFVATATRHLSPSATLDPVERLDLYHRQYWYRVLDSLQEDFPALEHLLGEGTVYIDVNSAPCLRPKKPRWER